MGTWSPKILGNDTSCEVRERFIELYNEGFDVGKIIDIVLEEHAENLELDSTNVWSSLSLICWECKSLPKEIFEIVREIITSGKDEQINIELKSDEKFIKQRNLELVKLLDKISIERPKARKRIKPPKKIDFFISAGQCLIYQNQKRLFSAIYVTESEHFKNNGRIQFLFLDIESNYELSLEEIENSNVLWLKMNGPEWGNIKYTGRTHEISYGKTNKSDFENFLDKYFVIKGKLKSIDQNRICFNSQWNFVDFQDPKEVIRLLENKKMSDTFNISNIQMRLGFLLNDIGK